MLTFRDVVLAQLDKWRSEGLLTDEQHARLRARAAVDPTLDAPATGAAAATTPPAPVPAREHAGAAQAANWLQLVGGLLLGAAIVALVAFLGFAAWQAPTALMLMGLVVAAAGIALYAWKRDARVGLADAAIAAGLVPLAVAPFQGDAHSYPLYGGVAALAGVAALLVRRGNGPTAVLSSVAFALGTFAAIGPDAIFDGGANSAAPRVEWLVALAAFSLLLLAFRRETWSGVASGLLMAPHAGAFLSTMDALGVRGSETNELLIGGYFAVWLALGVWLGVRGLVAGAAAALTIDAVAFAYSLGGAGSALVLLLVLGGVLVWQAEFIRRYFGRKAS